MLYIEDFKNAFKKAKAIRDLENEIIDLRIRLSLAESDKIKKKIEERIKTVELTIVIQSGALFEIEKFIDECDDPFVSRLLYHRFINGESWVKVAHVTGGYNNADGVRKIVERYLTNKGITRRA